MKKRSRRFVTLQEPRILCESDREEFWDTLREMYNSGHDLSPEDRVAVSVLNSLYHHKRKVFCITKRSLEKLVFADTNWRKPPTYSPDRYSSQLKALYDFGISRVTHADKGLKTPGIFVVTDACPVNECFEVDVRQQLAEALAFAKPKGSLIADTAFYEVNRDIFHQFFISPDPLVEDSLKKSQKKYQEKEREREGEREKKQEGNHGLSIQDSGLKKGHWEDDPVPDYHFEDLL